MKYGLLFAWYTFVVFYMFILVPFVGFGLPKLITFILTQYLIFEASWLFGDLLFNRNLKFKGYRPGLYVSTKTWLELVKGLKG